MSAEKKVGILILISFAILVFFLIKTGSLSSIFEKKGYEIYSYFDSLAGLQERSPVRLAGVKIGYVKKISLDRGRALVKMKIFENYKISRGSRAAVTSMGIMGEKYIEIFPARGPGYIQPGESIEGIPPLSIDQIGTMFYSIAQDIKSLSKTFKDVLAGEKGKVSLNSIIQNIDRTVSSLSQLISTNRNNVNESVKELLASLRELRVAIGKFSKASEEIEKFSAEYRGQSDRIKTLSLKMTNLSEKAEELLSRVNVLLEEIQGGKGSLGKVIQDETLYKKTVATLENASSVTKRVQESLARIEFSVSPYLYFSSENLGKVGVELFSKNNFLRANLVADSKGKTYDLLFGKRYPWFSLASGIIEGSFGFSASIYSKGGLFLSGDVYNPNSWEYRVLLGARRKGFSFFGGYSKKEKLLFGISYGF